MKYTRRSVDIRVFIFFIDARWLFSYKSKLFTVMYSDYNFVSSKLLLKIFSLKNFLLNIFNVNTCTNNRRFKLINILSIEG